MNAPFPLGLESAVTFYVALYILTLVLHAVFAAYVLAGSLYVAVVTLFPGSGEIPRTQQPIAAMLREWMPAMLSGAITAAVAPLLFMQIIYRQQFYTANLLLGWRWLVVIPVLILAFYFLYVLKNKAISAWPALARGSLAVTTAGCFVFVAFCWSTNHLLSIQDETWPEVWLTGTVIQSVPALLLRLTTWIAGMFPVMAAVVALQLRNQEVRSGTSDSADSAHARSELAGISLCGLIGAVVCGTVYLTQLADPIRDLLVSVPGVPWLICLAIGAILQAIGWLLYRRQKGLGVSILMLIPGGGLLVLLAAGCIREIVRMAQVDMEAVSQSCGRAADIGGFILFLVAAGVTGLLAAGCVALTIRELRSAATEQE